MNFTGKKEQPPTADLLLASSSSSYDRHQHHGVWQQLVDDHRPVADQPEPSSNHEEEAAAAGMMVEREHMFDKVVTPSDVGKLNRLVIPKQHAERCFPLDSSTTDKGLLLNFEDRSGKLWRFRYSYWNSSQSYVMTKGWSRFVKEKKLDAGDIVSFQRGVGVTAKDRLFIDWRRRVDASASRLSSSNLSFSFPHHNFVHPWNPLVLRPMPTFQRRNFSFIPQTLNNYGSTAGGSRSVICFGPGDWGTQIPSPASQSTPPVSTGKASGKRLRLFGVNMDCPIDENEDNQDHDPLNISINTTVVTSSAIMNPFSMGRYNYDNYDHGHSPLLIPPPPPPSSSSISTIPYLQLKPHGGRTESNLNMILSASPAHDFNTNAKSRVSNISLDLDI